MNLIILNTTYDLDYQSVIIEYNLCDVDTYFQIQPFNEELSEYECDLDKTEVTIISLNYDHTHNQ